MTATISPAASRFLAALDANPKLEDMAIPLNGADWFDLSVEVHKLLKERKLGFTTITPDKDGMFVVQGFKRGCGYCGSFAETVQYSPDSWPCCPDCGGV
jgi:hypothetical protein